MANMIMSHEENLEAPPSINVKDLQIKTVSNNVRSYTINGIRPSKRTFITPNPTLVYDA